MNEFKKKIKKEIRGIKRFFTQITPDDLLRSFSEFKDFNASALMVHSSLSAFGHIQGGPASVISTLKKWIGDAPLVVPAHSYCYPDASGRIPIFDLETPSRVGAVTNYLMKLPGSYRSLHPTHSVVAAGAGSDLICEGHELCHTPCGRGTPYEKLINQDCAVLMFGATMNTYTFFHTAEDAAEVPYLYENNPYDLLYKDKKGSVHTLVMRRQDMSFQRRFSEMDQWLESKKLLIKKKLAAGIILFIPSAGMVHDTLVKELKKDPFFLIAKNDNKNHGDRNA